MKCEVKLIVNDFKYFTRAALKVAESQAKKSRIKFVMYILFWLSVGFIYAHAKRTYFGVEQQIDWYSAFSVAVPIVLIFVLFIYNYLKKSMGSDSIDFITLSKIKGVRALNYLSNKKGVGVI